MPWEKVSIEQWAEELGVNIKLTNYARKNSSSQRSCRVESGLA